MDYAEETSPCQKANRFSWTAPILSRGVVKDSARSLPEACQKLVDGYQKRLIEVKMAKGHVTKY